MLATTIAEQRKNICRHCTHRVVALLSSFIILESNQRVALLLLLKRADDPLVCEHKQSDAAVTCSVTHGDAPIVGGGFSSSIFCSSSCCLRRDSASSACVGNRGNGSCASASIRSVSDLSKQRAVANSVTHFEAEELDFKVEGLVRLDLWREPLGAVRILWRDDEPRDLAAGHRRYANVPALDHLLCSRSSSDNVFSTKGPTELWYGSNAPRPSWNSKGSSVPPTSLPSTMSRLQQRIRVSWLD